MYNVKAGQHYYAPHRGLWGVWKMNETVNGVSTAYFVKDFVTKEEARSFVFESNGWNKKTN